jgi:hypothetical protein
MEAEMIEDDDKNMMESMAAHMFLLEQRMCKLEEIVLQLTVESRASQMDWENFKPGGTA